MSDVDPWQQPRPRVLVDLAAFERVDLAPANSRDARSDARSVPRFARARAGSEPARLSAADRSAVVTLGRLAREGRLEFCSYGEFEAPSPSVAQWRGTWRSLLGEVPVATILPAVDRRALGDDVFSGDAQAGSLARLCARMKHDEGGRESLPFDELPLPEGAVAARSAERFGQLAARVQGHRLADVFHLWSAELADCAWWLTLDPTLAPFVQERVEPGLAARLRCAPVLPDRLLERLGITERDEVPGAASRVVTLRPT